MKSQLNTLLDYLNRISKVEMKTPPAILSSSVRKYCIKVYGHSCVEQINISSNDV